MASPQTKTNGKPATTKHSVPQSVPKPEPPKRGIGETVRKSLQGDLEEHLERFMKDAWFEEKHFLNEVLRDWNDNTGGGRPRERGAREVPLFSAIEWQLSGHNCLPCPDHMIEQVTKFIDDNETPRPRYDTRTAVDRNNFQRKRLEQLRVEFEDFTGRASFEDIFWLLDILNRYRGIMEYDEDSRPEEVMRSAAAQALDSRSWVIKAPYECFASVKTLMEILSAKTWMSDFLRWIAVTTKESADPLTPCAIAAEAQTRQEKFDADIKTARQLKKSFPELIA